MSYISRERLGAYPEYKERTTESIKTNAQTEAVDLLMEDGDLVLTKSGDLTTISGIDEIVKTLMTRLGTSAKGTARAYLLAGDTRITTNDFANLAYTNVSAKLNASSIQQIRYHLEKVADEDGRIEIINVIAQPRTTARTLSLQLIYRLRGSQQDGITVIRL